ncbi:MAG: bacteriohemerythrin [Sulfuritalea sp.]|nr:bacteriohemerythrin [Sulfuritalea sp.]
MLTGIHEIDQQHQVLFDALARLEQAVTSDDKWSAVHFALVELTGFVNVHFAVEEALMRLHGYPDLEAHIAAHRAFSADLVEIKQMSIREDVSREMTAMLKDWLVRHIGVADKDYVPHLRRATVIVAAA